jgi:hypothetical protein
MPFSWEVTETEEILASFVRPRIRLVDFLT